MKKEKSKFENLKKEISTINFRVNNGLLKFENRFLRLENSHLKKKLKSKEDK